jgi:carbon starvation protein
MSATLMAVMGLGAMFLGYRFYSNFIAKKIYQLDPNFETPAHAMRDDVDYLPTKRLVLWGHHFTTVAGASPIVGPGIAVIWGWLPAVIWVTVGTVFLAGVHDFGAIWASVRNRGRSMGALTGDIVSPRSRSLFMIVIFLLLLMVNAVFAVVISTAFVATPSSVIPTWASLPVAIAIGLLIYKARIGLLWPTVVGTILLYAAIFLGSVMPVSLPAELFGVSASVQWILILFAYCALASLLPVWLLLQPRDFINGVQLFVGLGLMYGAIFLARPTIVAPAINLNVPPGAPPLVPLLFVTIACGAISGFHGLVGSGTTSKQLDKEPDARFVGYLGALGEGSLALVTIIAATAGFATLADWEGMYSSFGQGGVLAFVTGGASILNRGFGLSVPFASTMLTVMAVLFAATTMDSAVRLQRYIIQEWGAIYRLPLLQNAYAATFFAVGTCLMLVFGAGGSTGTGGMVLWPLFGTTNQLLAGLTLLVISVMLVKLGRPARYTLVPMIFVTGVSLLAALYQLWSLYARSQYLLLVVDLMIIIAALFVILEAASALMRERRVPRSPVASLASD